MHIINPRVIDKRVDPPKCASDLPPQRFDCSRITQISAAQDMPCAVERAPSLFGSGSIGVVMQRNARAALCQGHCYGAADPSGRPCNEYLLHTLGCHVRSLVTSNLRGADSP